MYLLIIFCDRRPESERLVNEVMNGNNQTLVSTRLFLSIYDSRSLRDLVFALSKEILEVLKPAGRKALQGFWECVKSLQTSISFDVNGIPTLYLGLGDIQAPALKSIGWLLQAQCRLR